MSDLSLTAEVVFVRNQYEFIKDQVTVTQRYGLMPLVIKFFRSLLQHNVRRRPNIEPPRV